MEIEQHSCEDMKDTALAHGWKAETVPDVSKYLATNNPMDIVWKLYAKRDQESLVVKWHGNAQTSARYNYGDYWLYPAWRNGVMKLITGKPNPKKFSAKDRGRASEVTYEEVIKERNVPWQDDEKVPAMDVLLAVLGRTICWISKGSMNKIRTEFCPKESNLGKSTFKVHTTLAGRRVLEWANAYGFQACYISDILDID